MATIEDIKETALIPFQKHRQLSMHEAEVITLEIIGLLCDSECKDEKTLKYLGRFLTPDMYQDLVDERNLNKDADILFAVNRQKEYVIHFQ